MPTASSAACESASVQRCSKPFDFFGYPVLPDLTPPSGAAGRTFTSARRAGDARFARHFSAAKADRLYSCRLIEVGLFGLQGQLLHAARDVAEAIAAAVRQTESADFSQR